MVKAYDSLHVLLRLLIQLIFGWPVSAIYRIVKGLEKKDTVVLVAGILAIPFGFIFWVVDLITTVLGSGISVLA